MCWSPVKSLWSRTFVFLDHHTIKTRTNSNSSLLSAQGGGVKVSCSLLWTRLTNLNPQSPNRGIASPWQKTVFNCRCRKRSRRKTNKNLQALMSNRPCISLPKRTGLPNVTWSLSERHGLRDLVPFLLSFSLCLVSAFTSSVSILPQKTQGAWNLRLKCLLHPFSSLDFYSWKFMY